MAEPVILFVKPKAISAADKKNLRTAGVIVVEVDDIANVKLVRATPELESSELLRAAATALKDTKYSSWHLQAFGGAVAQAILSKVPSA